jgi:hypothetical protein
MKSSERPDDARRPQNQRRLGLTDDIDQEPADDALPLGDSHYSGPVYPGSEAVDYSGAYDDAPSFQPVQGAGRGSQYSPLHNQATSDNPYYCVNCANGVTVDEGLRLPSEYL